MVPGRGPDTTLPGTAGTASCRGLRLTEFSEFLDHVFLLTGVVFLANLLGKCAPKKFPAASRAQKCLKRVAVGATGLLNNEPEAQFRGLGISHKK